MKPSCFSARWFSPLIASLFLLSSLAVAQRKEGKIANGANPGVLSAEQQDAYELLKGLAQNLKGASDKLTAAVLQARIADALWQFDESFAKEVFRWSFDVARQPASDDLTKEKRAAYEARQASCIREILSRLGAHDQIRGEAWLKAFEEDEALKSRSSESNHFHSDSLMQIALQLVTSNPEQAQRLGLVSLSGNQIPEGFGRLLFALNNVNRGLSDELFRAALQTLRRNDCAYDGALVALVNYLFSSSGTLSADADIADARLLANYFVDAAWRQARGDGPASLPESSAMFYSLVEVRGLPIVSQYAAPRLPELSGQMRELAARLTQAQMESTASLRAAQQQQATVANRNNYDIDEQIERAEKEKDIQVRDALFNSLAHALMRSDSERALKVAARIDDADVRMPAEDDINLVRIQSLLQLRSYEEARKTALKLHRDVLQAKVLVELASKVLAENKDTGRATALLSEASELALKTEPKPDKLTALLLVAQHFAKFDPLRGFESLGDAVKTINQLKTEEKPTRSTLSKRRLLTIKTYTVINGSEVSTSDQATVESIDFSQIAPFVAHDYMQTRLLGNKIEDPMLRARFLIAVASAMLSTVQHKPNIGKRGTAISNLLRHAWTIPRPMPFGVTIAFCCVSSSLSQPSTDVPIAPWAHSHQT